MKSDWISDALEPGAAIDRCIEDPAHNGGEVLAVSTYRRVVRLEIATAPFPIVVKQYFSDRKRRSAPERALARLRRLARKSPAQREWRAMVRLHRAGIAVPEPLAFARRSDGGALIVTPFLAGAKTLSRALEGYGFERQRIIRNVGTLVHRLHDQGFVHGDLHAGNILVGEKGPILIDLQRVRRIQSQSDRIRDIAFLDFSLYQLGVTRSDRLRFRIAAVDLGHFRVASERETLREIGRASQARSLDYYRGRTRRTRRPGEECVAVVIRDQSGLRRPEFSEDNLREALAAHQIQVDTRGSSLIKCDHRARVSAVRASGRKVIVKEAVKSSARKRLADVFRGSAGRRAWVGGRGLRIRGIEAATPLAYLERKQWGIPVSSLVVLEDLSSARSSADVRPNDREAQPLPKQLLRLALRLHSTGALHADFQAMHIYLVKRGDATELALIDLEGVRFPRRLQDRQRIQMLAEINATIDDDVIGPDVRAWLFRQYVRRLPFESGNELALSSIVQRSLAREQRWRGVDCDLSRNPR